MIRYFRVVLLLCVIFVSERGWALSFWDMDTFQVRSLINEKILAIDSVKPEVFDVKDVVVERKEGNVPLRIYIPNTHDHFPVILMIHGGGWVAGSLETHDNMARYLCRGVEAVVVSVDYTNSPEGKFPLPLEQCYDALRWIAGHAKDYHADPSRLAVVGDSAGGNMAAALTLLARDRQGPAIAMQVLINPSLDLTGNGTLERQNDPLDSSRWYATQYVADPNDVNSPYVSPLLAQELSGLPPALIILAEKDDLRPEGTRYAERLKAAGVSTNSYTQWGVGHLAGNGARASSQAQESLDIATAALRGLLIKR